MGKGERPEHQAPPEIFYSEEEAHKYTHNSRIISIQASLTKRAMELLALPKGGGPRLLLDIGCGSGLSGQELSDMGHVWMGMDISAAMLDVAVDRECDGDVWLGDMGHGLPLRPGTFDGAISISAVQWLCNADKTVNDPRKRLKRFFETLYGCLARGARAVLQVYPESPAQAEMMVGAAMKVGFSGGLVVDYPHSTRAKKYFLVLMVGTTSYLPSAKGLDGSEPVEEGEEAGSGDEEEEEDGEEATEVKVGVRRRVKATRKKGRVGQSSSSSGKAARGSKDWVVAKKDVMRKRGYTDIPVDTKYTARKRSKFRQ